MGQGTLRNGAIALALLTITDYDDRAWDIVSEAYASDTGDKRANKLDHDILEDLKGFKEWLVKKASINTWAINLVAGYAQVVNPDVTK